MKEQTGWKSSDPEKRDVESGGEASDSEHGADGPTSDPEVAALPQRRTFTAEYKEQILAAVETLGYGEIGTFLRHEGLTSSVVSRWRRTRDAAVKRALEAKKPGPTPKTDPRDERIAELERKLKRTEEELGKAKVIIDVQKKVSELLALDSSDESDETS